MMLTKATQQSDRTSLRGLGVVVRPLWSRTGLALVVAASILAMSACASATPKPANRPALSIPLPPPHIRRTDAGATSRTGGGICPPPPVAPPPARPGRGNRDVSKPAATEIKPDPKLEELPAPAPAPTPVPAPQLRTVESTGGEKAVRATVDRARQLLGGVDYRVLNKERKKAYDDAKQFAQQADDALKAGNTVFAQGVASKAETLAKELAGR